jgi:hypothetical protein
MPTSPAAKDPSASPTTDPASKTKTGPSTNPGTSPASKPNPNPSTKPDPGVKTGGGTMTSKNKALEGQKIFNQTGAPLYTIAGDGTIRDATKGTFMGQYTANGEYFDTNGNKVGYVKANTIRTEKGKIIASFKDNGRVYDGKGNYLGTVTEEGIVLNSKGTQMGSAPGIDKNLAVLMFFFPKHAVKR